MSKKRNSDFTGTVTFNDDDEDYGRTSAQVQAEAVTEDDEETRSRPRRKTTYTRIRETQIPPEVRQAFLKDDWSLRFVRFSINGVPDDKNLARRESEGYEFVRADELRKMGLEWYLGFFRIEDGRSHKNLLVSGDVALMKADVNLVKDRQKQWQQETNRQIAAVEVYTKGKKRGFLDAGSSSKVSYSEPKFQN